MDASLIEWEDGVDLVLGIDVDRTPAQIWPHLTDPRLVDVWFVGYQTAPEAGSGDQGASAASDAGEQDAVGAPAGSRLLFTFDDEPVPGEVLSSQPPSEDPDEAHLLVEIEGIGRLGLTLRAEREDPGEGVASANAPAADAAASATRISLAHTVADPDTDPELIASVVEQVGPVWETHLRLLAEELAREAGDTETSFDVPEAELTARYQRLAEELA